MTIHSAIGSQQRITDQTLQIGEREWFKKYTIVHFVQATYKCGSIEQKESIGIHALSQEEKRV